MTWIMNSTENGRIERHIWTVNDRAGKYSCSCGFETYVRNKLFDHERQTKTYPCPCGCGQRVTQEWIDENPSAGRDIPDAFGN